MPLAMRRKLKSRQQYSLPGNQSLNNSQYDDDLCIDDDEPALSAAEGGSEISIDKIQRKKRRNESAQDVYDRLEVSGFFAKDIKEIIGG